MQVTGWIGDDGMKDRIGGRWAMGVAGVVERYRISSTIIKSGWEAEAEERKFVLNCIACDCSVDGSAMDVKVQKSPWQALMLDVSNRFSGGRDYMTILDSFIFFLSLPEDDFWRENDGKEVEKMLKRKWWMNPFSCPFFSQFNLEYFSRIFHKPVLPLLQNLKNPPINQI